MANTLVSPADLADFPGAPFTQGVVDACVAALRREVRWHIAPEVTETVTVDAKGGTVLFAPTLVLTAVTEIRDMTPDVPEVLEDWTRSRSGMLYRAEGWPCGFGSVEIDMTHGYTTTPPELFLAVAEKCQGALTNSTIGQETAGGESISYRAGNTTSAEVEAIIDLFRVPPRFR